MPDKNTLNIILTTEKIVLDPVHAKGYQQFEVLNLFLDTLVRKSQDGGIVSGVAESWEVKSSNAHPAYRFTLSREAKFHNRDPVLAQDVVFSFDRHLNSPSSAISSYLRNVVESIKADGKYTINFKLLGPYPPFLELMATPGFGIVSHKSTSQNVIGSGPYSLKSQSNNGWRFTKNPLYKRPVMNVNEFCFYIERDADKTVNALNSGRADLAMGSPLEVALSGNLKESLVRHSMFHLATTHAILNYNNPFFHQLENRQFIKSLLYEARQEKILLTEFDQPLDTFLPHGMMPSSYYVEEKSFFMRRKTLGSKDKKSLQLVFPYGIFLKSSVKKIVQRFEEAEFKVSYIDVKGQDLLNPMLNGDYDIIFIPYQGVISDPDGYLDLLSPESMIKSAQMPTQDLLKALSEVRFLSDGNSRLHAYENILKEWEKKTYLIPFSQNGIPIVFQKNLNIPSLNSSFHLCLRDIEIKN